MIMVEDVVLEDLALSESDCAHLDEVWIACARRDVEAHPARLVEDLDVRNGSGDAVVALVLERYKSKAVVFVVNALSNLGPEERRENGQKHFCLAYIHTLVTTLMCV
eukprot:XP_001704921.1 Hypothetical protein GL50803_31873 [Giardia lamblia ATCC 50803]